MKKYGYARCSTNESKQDIDRQKRELLAAGVATADIFWEYESGRNENRKEFCRMMTIVKDGDTIVSTEISRITRSTRQLCDLIETVKQKRMCLNIIGSVKIDCSKGTIDPMTNAFLQMAGVFAELEVNMTSARIKSGLVNARAKGSRLGEVQGEATDRHGDLPAAQCQPHDRLQVHQPFRRLKGSVHEVQHGNRRARVHLLNG